MSHSVLKPFLENITGVTVVLQFSERPDDIRFELD